MVSDFVSQDSLERVAQVVLQNHLGVDRYLSGSQVNLGHTRLCRVFPRLPQQQESRPLGLRQRPAPIHLAAQFIVLSKTERCHAALSTIQSFCESMELATRYPARTTAARNGLAR